MKLSLAVLCLAAACAPMEHRFVKIDNDFAARSRADAPAVYVNEAEMLLKLAPPYRYVGVVEVEGKETEKLSTFYERVSKAGSEAGCEAMLQRDAFQAVVFAQDEFRGRGRVMIRNDMAIWQFLCGVRGATNAESTASLKLAVSTALRMRADMFGRELCAAYMPTGSHVLKTRVCADDPGGHSRPDAPSSDH